MPYKATISKYFFLIFTDRSAGSLVFANLIIILLALKQGWKLGELLYIYWWQNVIIGFFNVLRIMSFKDAAPEGKTPQLAEAFKMGRFVLSGFFALHFGVFHFVYLQFLKGFARSDNFTFLFIPVLIFLLNHLFSFVYNFKKDCANFDFQRVFMLPYQRIIPMHLTIMFGTMIIMFLNNPTGEKLALVLFLILKTVVNVKMHLIEHGVRLA